LNLLGDFKFFLNRQKGLLLGENAVSNEVTQAEYKGEKPYWFDVASTKHAKANEISVKNEETVNDKAHGHHAEFEREAARRAEDKQEEVEKNPTGQDEKAVADIDCSAGDAQKVEKNRERGEDQLHTEHPQDDAAPAGLHYFEKQEQQRQGEGERDGTNDVTGNGGRDGKHGEERRFAQEYADGVKDDIYAEVEKSAVRGLFAKKKNTHGDEADGQENCADSNGKKLSSATRR